MAVWMRLETQMHFICVWQLLPYPIIHKVGLSDVKLMKQLPAPSHCSIPYFTGIHVWQYIGT